MHCHCSALKEGGKARGLPSGVLLQDLVASKTEAIPPTHDDGNPDVGCEFFETRQVMCLIACNICFSSCSDIAAAKCVSKI